MNGTLPRWTRREFLLLALAGLAGCRSYGGAGNAVSTADTLPEWVQGGTGDLEAAARFGRAYLERHPGEAGRQRLIALLERTLKRRVDGVSLASLPDAKRIELLREQVRAEYTGADVVQVQGWVLSRSEARLYGLVALAQAGRSG